MTRLCTLLLLTFLPSMAMAQIEMSIPDPYDPTRRVPLDDSGQVDCRGSKLNGGSPGDCVKAKAFYKQRFANPDLRFSQMADQVRPHPKHLVRAFLTTSGVSCRGITADRRDACTTARTIFSAMGKEEQQVMIDELTEKLPPMMIIPLEGDLDCSWSSMSKDQYAACLKQNDRLQKMLFEERLKHNERAFTIIHLLETFQRMARRCK